MTTLRALSHDTTFYRPENANWMAKFCALAYTKVDAGSAPDGESILAELKRIDASFEAVHSYDAKSSQAILIKHSHYVVAAFRGTDELGDWFDNVNALSTDGPFGGVHRGFYAALLDVWPAMREQYKRYRRPQGHNLNQPRPFLPLWITGHSLGGAMATLAAAELINADEPFFGLYTFGSPRAGDRDFARVFNVEAVGRAYRFQNNNDIVTRVPARLMGYSHVGSLVYISADGALSKDPGRWFQFLDRVTGAANELNASGIDQIEDHGIEKYMTAISNWGDTPLE